jgi:hypothetical protein
MIEFQFGSRQQDHDAEVQQLISSHKGDHWIPATYLAGGKAITSLEASQFVKPPANSRCKHNLIPFTSICGSLICTHGPTPVRPRITAAAIDDPLSECTTVV